MTARQCSFRFAILGGAMAINSSPNWFKSRNYLHFDPKINNASTAVRIATDPQAVIRHSFYPFIHDELVVRRYKPKERRTVKKIRDISYAAHMDAHIFSYYSYLLSVIYEGKLISLGLKDSVIAYRSLGKCNIHFAKEAFDAIVRIGECHVIAMDVEKFFDTMDHAQLKSRWCDLIGVSLLPDDHYTIYRNITRYSYVERKEIYRMYKKRSKAAIASKRLCTPEQFQRRIREKRLINTNTNKKGIPQGSPISAMLSNLYMIGFDENIQRIVNAHGAYYRRYSDDILVIIPINCQIDFAQIITDELKKYLLESSDEKTVISEFRYDSNGILNADKPVQYLGFTFDGIRRLIRSTTLARYHRRMKAGVYFAFVQAIKDKERSPSSKKTLFSI